MASFSEIGVRAVVKDVNKYISDMGRMEDSTTSLGDVLATLGVSIGAAEIGRAVWQMTQLGAENQRLATSFYDLAKAAGQSGDEILAAMMRAADGTIDDEELMQAANQATLRDLKLTADQWGQLVLIARDRARALGTDTLGALSQMIEAIASGYGRSLRELGFTDITLGISGMADALDTTTANMTTAQKAQVLLNQVLEQGGKKIQEQGGIIKRDYVDAISTLRVQYEELKDTIAADVAPKVIPVITAVTDWVKEQAAMNAFGQAVQTATGSYDEFNKVFDQAIGKTTVERTKLWELALAELKAKQATNALADENHRFVQGMTAGDKIIDSAAISTAVLSSHMRILALMYKGAKGIIAQYNVTLQHQIDLQQQEANTKAAIGRMVDLGEAIQDYGKINERTAEDVSDAWESAWDSLVSDVQSALQETQVTAEDIARSTWGGYTDKWDENRRRLQAVVSRGFAELQAHADWAQVLGVPEDVMRGTEQQLRDWAQNAINAGPAQWGDVNAAVAVVEQFMAQKAATDAFYNEVAAEYARRHGLGIGAGKAAVTGALGGPAAEAKNALAGLPADLAAQAKGMTGQIQAAVAPIADAILSGITLGLDRGWPAFIAAFIARFTTLGASHGTAPMSAPPSLLPPRTTGRMMSHSVGGDTIIQNISDPATLYLALAIAQDKKRSRWNAAMGMT